MMDHLQEAKNAAQTGIDSHREDADKSAQFCTQQAIAHALIALVERLDKVIFADQAGDERGQLRVTSTNPFDY